MRAFNSLSQAQLEVRLGVERAFGKKMPPESSEIISSKCIEPVMVREFFKGRCWWSITLQMLRADYPGDGSACLSFMSPKGRNYYLPAYLLIASEYYWEGGDISLEFPSRLLMYAQDDQAYKMSMLTSGEMKAVADVLRFLVAAYDDEDAQEALDCLWKDY